MADVNEAQLDAEIAALEAQLTAPVSSPDTGYSIGQGLYDIGTGALKAGAGLADVITLPAAAALRLGGIEYPYFGISKMLSEDLATIAPQIGLTEGTPVQELASFVTPLPGGTKAQLAKQAGLGLASYLGAKTGEAIAPESALAPIIGAVSLPLTGQTLAKGLSGLTGAATRNIKLLAGSQPAIQEAATREVLSNLGPEGIAKIAAAQEVPTFGVSPLGSKLTAAEIAQTPSAARYQQLMQLTEPGGSILLPLETERKEAQRIAAEALGVQPETGQLAELLRRNAEAKQTLQNVQLAEQLDVLKTPVQELPQTPLARGTLLQESLLGRAKASNQKIKEAWAKVPDKTKVDASYALNQTRTEFSKFGPIALEEALSNPTAQRIVGKINSYLDNKDGIITVGELQDLRSAASDLMSNVSGALGPRNRRLGYLMGQLREDLDLVGTEQAILAKQPTAITKLKDAIRITAAEKEQFTRGVVGQLTRIKQFKPAVKASRVLDLALQNPENAQEIIGKFGRESTEALTLRAELIDRLNAATNPSKFLSKHNEVIQPIFGKDYDTLVNFAKTKTAKTGYEPYLNVSDAIIPKAVFGNETSAQTFMQQFAGSEAIPFARGKFLNERILKRGNTVTNLTANDKIARVLFQDDYPNLIKLTDDIEASKSVAQLEKAASRGESISAQRAMTALGTLVNGRALLSTLKKGVGVGALVGFTGGLPGSIAGALSGVALEKLATIREQQLNAAVSKLLANPESIKIAAAPPTVDNMQRLLSELSNVGINIAKGGTLGSQIDSFVNQIQSNDVSLNESALDDEIAKLEAQLGSSKTSQKVTATPISTVLEQKPPVIRAIAWQESRYNPKAIGPKTKAGQAKGVMQLTDATAKSLGVADPFNPEENINAGERYYNKLLKQFGNRELALAAYNWGEGNLRKALRKVAAQEVKPTWANVLQYAYVPKETRSYVKSIVNKMKEFEV